MKRHRSISYAGQAFIMAALAVALAGCGTQADTTVPPVSAHPQVPTPTTTKPPFHKLPPLTAKGRMPGDVPN